MQRLPESTEEDAAYCMENPKKKAVKNFSSLGFSFEVN